MAARDGSSWGNSCGTGPAQVGQPGWRRRRRETGLGGNLNRELGHRRQLGQSVGSQAVGRRAEPIDQQSLLIRHFAGRLPGRFDLLPGGDVGVVLSALAVKQAVDLDAVGARQLIDRRFLQPVELAEELDQAARGNRATLLKPAENLAVDFALVGQSPVVERYLGGFLQPADDQPLDVLLPLLRREPLIGRDGRAVIVVGGRFD